MKEWKDVERGESIDATVAIVRTIKESLREHGKGRMNIVREIPGVGIQHWSVKVEIAGGSLDLNLESRGLSLHEAALGMQVILEGVL